MTATTRLDPQRYLAEVDTRTGRVLDIGPAGRDKPVPSCPGWSVADVADHLAMVYEHKVRVMAENRWPSPWSPDDGTLEGDPFDLLGDALQHLMAEFAGHPMDEQTTTFAMFDTTIGFWARRMALEVAVHCRDVEQSLSVEPLPIPSDLGADGVDEILTATLAGPWWESRVVTAHPVDAVVALETAGHRWLCSLDATSVTVGQTAVSPAVTLSAPPDELFLWLWGRGDGSSIRADGREDLKAEFRGRLAECTG